MERHYRQRLTRVAVALLTGVLTAAEPAKETESLSHDAATLFVEVVQPTLKQQCLGCHGEGNTFSELDLRTCESMLKGGKPGPSLMPSRATDSLLVQVLDGSPDLQMPPGDGKQLPAETILAVRRWIDGGAPFAEAQARQKWDYAEEDLWAFRPVRDVEPPGVGLGPEEVQTPIDHFIEAKLGNMRLGSGPRADHRTLISRLTFDLHGLPPTPEETQVFLDDTSLNAYKRLLEHLLASPRYGERRGPIGSTSPATPTPTDSRTTSSAPMRGAIKTTSSAPLTRTSPTTSSFVSRSPATCCIPATPRR